MRLSVLITLLFFYLSCVGEGSRPSRAIFCTDSEETANTALTFAFVTDVHISVASPAVEDFRACVEDINSLDSVAFVIFGGDLTDFGSDEELALVKSMMDSLAVPYYVVAGNHDANWSESGCNSFLRTFGYEHFTFEAGDWRFMGCGSGPDMRMAPALIPRESMLWLQGEEDVRKTIFINHYPLDSMMLNYFDVTRELLRLDTRFVIGGHIHRNKTMSYSGIPAALCRSSLRSGSVPGYNLVTLTSDSISFAERRIYPEGAVQLEPWRTEVLTAVSDTITYDDYGLPADYPWLRYEVNEQYPQVRERWRFQESANIVAGFAVDARMAYYTTADGHVCAVRLRNGRQRWSHKFPGKIFSTPTVSGKILVFGCTDGKIYALKTRNGRVLWSYKATKSVVASPAIHDGRVYIGASDGVFRALNLRDGELIWAFSGVEGHVASTPCVDSEQVVFGSWGRKLYSLDPLTGALQWVWESHKPSRMYSPASCVPLKSQGRIFIAVPDRKTYAIDAYTGEELFAVSGGRDALCLSEDGEAVYSKTMFHHLLSIPVVPKADGVPLNWNAETGIGYDIAPSALSACGGVVLIPCDKGNIVALSSEDGSILWKHKLSIALINPLAVWRKGSRLLILASSMDGTVALLQAPV